jgi:hypothetical protein
LGLGTSSFDQEDFSDLFLYTEDNWVKLKETAHIQGVSAIVLDGINVIMNELGAGCFNRSFSPDAWKLFVLQWIGEVQQGYEAGNMQQMVVVDNVQRHWGEAGIRMMLMKGLAMGIYYPVPKHRAPGDIDCYLFDDYAKGNEAAKTWADTVDVSWYKHSVISYKGQTIENHHFFVHTREGKISKQLNQQLCDTLNEVDFETLPGTGVLLPPPMFNALFLSYHALGHFLEEGLRLKQLLDWAMFLKRDANKIDWPLFYSWCEKYHFRRFVDVTTDIAVHRFGIALPNLQITDYSPFAEKVVQSTLSDNDYVFNNSKGEWYKRWLILQNLFKYRWKYHLIYQHSILRQLWFYIVGFIFKTDR